MGTGSFLFHPGIEIDEALPSRIDAGQQAGARGATDRDLAVGAIEEQSLGGEPVKVGGLDVGCAIGTQLGAHVVVENEQDIFWRRQSAGE